MATLFAEPAQRINFDEVATDPSNDTIVAEAMTKTVFVQSGWKSSTFHNLSEVEDFLDSLEASGIAHREVRSFGNSTFAVRWK